MFWFLAEAAFLILLTVIIVCINSIMSKCDFVKIWKLKYLFFVGLIQFWHFLQRFHSVVVLYVVIFQLLNCVQLFEIPWIAARQAPLAFTKPQFTQIHVHCVIQPSHTSSATRFFFCHPSFPATGSFTMSCLFTSHGQIIGVLASASVFSMNIQGWFPLVLTGLVSLQSKELLRVFLQHHNSKASILYFFIFFYILF